jgi:hypothetical protein
MGFDTAPGIEHGDVTVRPCSHHASAPRLEVRVEDLE